MSSVYDATNLHFKYHLEGVSFDALKDVSLKISAGDMITFAGPSGSGKSTLLNLLGLMEEPQGASLSYFGKDLSTLGDEDKNQIRRFDIGFVFQSFNLFPVLSAFENVEFFLTRQGVGERERQQRVMDALAVVGIEDLKDKRPPQLSGGQRQRVAIARALAKNPKVIIADEPTASLDQKNGEDVVNYLLTINKKFKTTIIMASHDPMVLAHSPKILHLRDGRVVEKHP